MGILQRWADGGIDQKVAFTGTSAQSAAFGAETFAILLSCSQNCHITVGSNPTATANSWMLKSTDPGMILGVYPGQKIAVIQDSAGGNLFIKELTQ